MAVASCWTPFHSKQACARRRIRPVHRLSRWDEGPVVAGGEWGKESAGHPPLLPSLRGAVCPYHSFCPWALLCPAFEICIHYFTPPLPPAPPLAVQAWLHEFLLGS